MKGIALTPLKRGLLKMMSRAFAIVFLAAVVCALAPRAAAQNDGSISGQISDISGKPWPDIGIQAVSDQGVKSDARTNKDERYPVGILRAEVNTFNWH